MLSKRSEDKPSLTPLHHIIFDKVYHLAKAKNKSQLAAELLHANAGVNILKNDVSPIMQLAKDGDVESVDFLINNFIANPNHAIIGYALDGNVKQVERMLDDGADITCAIFGFARARNIGLVDAYLKRTNNAEASIRRALAGYAYGNHMDEMYAIISISFPNGFESIKQMIKDDIVYCYTLGGNTALVDTFLRLGANKGYALYGLASRGNKALVEQLLSANSTDRDLNMALEGYAIGVYVSEVEILLSRSPDVQPRFALHGYVRSGMFDNVNEIRKRNSMSDDAAFIYARNLYFDKLDEVLKAGHDISNCITDASTALTSQTLRLLPGGAYFSNENSALRVLSLINDNGLRNYVALDLQKTFPTCATTIKPKAVHINSTMSKYHLNYPQACAWIRPETAVLLMQVARLLYSYFPMEIVLFITANVLNLSDQDMTGLFSIYLNAVPNKLYEASSLAAHNRFFKTVPAINEGQLLNEQLEASDRYNRRINILE